MTPLSRFYRRWLPRPFDWCALALTYAFLLLATVAHLGYDAPTIVYLDVGR